MIRILFITFFLTAAFTQHDRAAWAKDPNDLPMPQGRVLLEIHGKFSNGNVTGQETAVAIFDRPMLEDLGRHRIETSTDWTDGVQLFEGPLMRDLLDRIGASGTTITATAANDYSVEIPVSDFLRYPVILAFEMNGKRLTLRDKGPIWIVYPRDDHPELNDPLINGRWIWQLKHIEIR